MRSQTQKWTDPLLLDMAFLMMSLVLSEMGLPLRYKPCKCAFSQPFFLKKKAPLCLMSIPQLWSAWRCHVSFLFQKERSEPSCGKNIGAFVWSAQIEKSAPRPRPKKQVRCAGTVCALHAPLPRSSHAWGCAGNWRVGGHHLSVLIRLASSCDST